MYRHFLTIFLGEVSNLKSNIEQVEARAEELVALRVQFDEVCESLSQQTILYKAANERYIGYHSGFFRNLCSVFFRNLRSVFFL